MNGRESPSGLLPSTYRFVEEDDCQDPDQGQRQQLGRNLESDRQSEGQHGVEVDQGTG